MPSRLERLKRKNDAFLVGSLGCHQGGMARAEILNPQQLSKIGQTGANARWHKQKS